jgi:hypothetical protein
MIKVSQKFHNPKEKPQIAECATLEDLLNVPFIQRWMADHTFYRICKSTTKTDTHLLIIETNQGNKHWAIATLEGDINELQLPEWKQQY